MEGVRFLAKGASCPDSGPEGQAQGARRAIFGPEIGRTKAASGRLLTKKLVLVDFGQNQKKNGFGRFWPEKLVLVDFGGKT